MKRELLLHFRFFLFITKRIRNYLFGTYVNTFAICILANVCVSWKKIRGNIGKISVSDRVGVNRSRISKRTRCKFPCCNLVSHLIRLTIFCFHCALTGRKDCESYLSVVTLPSLNGRYVRSSGKIQRAISTSFYRFLPFLCLLLLCFVS